MDFTTYQHPRHVSQRAKVLPERFLAHVTGILDVGDVLRYRISDDVGEPVTYCSLNICVYTVYICIYIYARVCVCVRYDVLCDIIITYLCIYTYPIVSIRSLYCYS